jgi:hypothetical protein
VDNTKPNQCYSSYGLFTWTTDYSYNLINTPTQILLISTLTLRYQLVKTSITAIASNLAHTPNSILFSNIQYQLFANKIILIGYEY